MSEEMELAKKIYWDYACNYFFMGHDGVLEDYRSHHPTGEEEREWRKEFIRMWISKISVDEFDAVHKLCNAHAVEAIPHLIENVEKGDSYAKLIFANAIHELSGCDGVDMSLQIQSHDTVIEQYQKILSTPLNITKEHEREITPLLKIVNAANAEEYVISYAKARLESVS